MDGGTLNRRVFTQLRHLGLASGIAPTAEPRLARSVELLYREQGPPSVLYRYEARRPSLDALQCMGLDDVHPVDQYKRTDLEARGLVSNLPTAFTLPWPLASIVPLLIVDSVQTMP